MKLTVKVYPNNEIRTTLTSEHTRKKTNKSNLAWTCLPTDEGGHFFVDRETHEAYLESQNETRETEVETASLSSLDISCDFQESLKPGYGGLPRKTLFGLRAKRTLQRVGGVFDKKFPKENCVFLTGTLPGSTSQAYEVMARWSGYIVNLLKTWVKYYADTEYSFHCWEFQRRGALHIHYCVSIDRSDLRERLIERFRDEWVSILESVSVKSGVDLFARGFGGTWRNRKDRVQAYAQVVRKSVAAYLAKYCSKGHDTENAFHCPSRWWGCSRAALHALEEMTLTLSLDSLSIRKALRLFEEVIHITAGVSNKHHIYRHGSGYGLSQVAYHVPSEPQGDIWKTLVLLYGDFSMAYSERKKNPEALEEMKFATSFLSCYQKSSNASLSVALQSQLQQALQASQQDAIFTITDWRELYSLVCLNAYNRSWTANWLTLKRIALRKLKRMTTDDYAQKLSGSVNEHGPSK